MQCVCVAFCLGKGRSFVEPWIVQEIKSRKMRAKGGLPGISESGRCDLHVVSLLKLAETAGEH
jgi:hypothetical protein